MSTVRINYDGITHEDTTSDESWLGSHIHNGLKTIPFSTVGENIENFRLLKIRDDDVFISSYPKSGNHWLSNIVKMLVSSDRCSYSGDFLAFNLIEKIGTERIQHLDSPRVISTHAPKEYFPNDLFRQGKGKVIQIYRNPKDLIVSTYFFGNKCGYYKGSLNGVIELFLQNKLLYGDWFEYVKQQKELSNSHPNQVILVKFEDLKKEPHEVIKKIAKFLGKRVTDDETDSILNLCSVSSMKNYLESKCGLEAEIARKIYRKGEVGDWKNHFTVAMNDEFNEAYMKNINRIGGDIELEW